MKIIKRSGAEVVFDPKKIIVASGTHKVYSLKAVLKGKLVNVLIVDYNLASKLMAISE